MKARTRLGAAAVAALLIGSGLSGAATPAQATFRDHNGRIAFRRFLNEERTWGAVFTIKPDGTHERQVTDPPEGSVDRNPDVSPDGRRIVFQREVVECDDVCNMEVFVVDVDGGNLTNLTNNPTDKDCLDGNGCAGSPAWSPDGRKIAFRLASGPIVDDLLDEQAIYIMDADGSDLRQVTQKVHPATGEDSDPQWSPDGRSLVFQRFNVRGAEPADGLALWTIDLRTGRERRITPFDLRAGDTPDWSPDGKRILFHSNTDGPSDVSANLYTVRANGTDLRQLTFEEGGLVNYLGSSYSPDGKKIVVGRRPATGGVNADIFIMNVDGTHERPLTQTVLYDSYPGLGPDTGQAPPQLTSAHRSRTSTKPRSGATPDLGFYGIVLGLQRLGPRRLSARKRPGGPVRAGRTGHCILLARRGRARASSRQQTSFDFVTINGTTTTSTEPAELLRWATLIAGR